MFFVSTGPHPRSAGQMDANRRRDLGQSDRARTEPPGGQSVRAGSDTHGERVRRGIRRIQVRTVRRFVVFFRAYMTATFVASTSIFFTSTVKSVRGRTVKYWGGEKKN